MGEEIKAFGKLEGKTLVLTINRPNVFNAIDQETSEILVKELDKASSSKGEIQSIVLKSEGKAFCSGQDLKDLDMSKVNLNSVLDNTWIPLINSIRKCRVPVIAAIDGVCAGAGVALVLACDLRLASEKAKFVSGFVQIGLVPDAGCTHTLVRHLGSAKTMEFALFNKPLSSQELLDAKIINNISASPVDEAITWATNINKMAPLAIKGLKENCLFAVDREFFPSLEQEKEGQGLLGSTEDFQEGVRAFLEKREPVFKGI